MQTFLRALLRGALRWLFKGVIGRDLPVRLQRAWMAGVTATTLAAGGTSRERAVIGVAGERVSRRMTDNTHAILYLHGGGYTLGSPGTHKALTTHLALAARCEVAVPDYRLAPEHPYPAGLEDAVSAYRALLQRYPATHLALAGDSAGGGLALCTAIALRDAGLPLPAGLILISPWTDLSLSGSTIDTLDAVDPLIGRSWPTRAAQAYRGTRELRDPLVSPLYADLAGLPPMLVQVGSDEVLLDDSRRLAERAQAAGVALQLEVETGYWHVFQVHAGVLDAADAAIARMARFLDRRWGRA